MQCQNAKPRIWLGKCTTASSVAESSETPFERFQLVNGTAQYLREGVQSLIDCVRLKSAGSREVVGEEKREIEMRRQWNLGVVSISLLLLGTANSAQATIVTNGGFETVNTLVSTEFGAKHPAVTESDWNATGYTFVFLNAKDTAAAFGGNAPVMFWGSDVTHNSVTGVGTRQGSPNGGNFVASDPSVGGPAHLTQMINGLVVHQQYDLSFYWAGAEQAFYSGQKLCDHVDPLPCTTDGWNVSVGGSLVDSVTQTDPNHTFTGWQLASVKFTATAASELLDFLATGGPTSSQPPFALLDGVTITQNRQPVPEPITLSILGAGLVGAMSLRRRKKALI